MASLNLIAGSTGVGPDCKFGHDSSPQLWGRVVEGGGRDRTSERRGVFGGDDTRAFLTIEGWAHLRVALESALRFLPLPFSGYLP